MYKQYLKVKPSKPGTGNGVFTTVQVPANVPVCQFRGNLLTKEEIDKSTDEVLEIGQDLYLGPSGGVDDVINHSCNPNCYVHIVGRRAVLYSLYVILSDTEITFDYSLNSTDKLDEWQMQCKCKSHVCRGTMSGIQYLDPQLVEDYKKKDIIPMFINKSQFKRL